MSNRIRFPRAARLPAAATPIPAAKLPPLRYGLFTPEGRLIKVYETPDPRYRICRTFNQMRLLDSEAIARPLTEGGDA